MAFNGRKLTDKEIADATVDENLTATESTDVARVSLFTDDQLASITTYADAAAMLDAAGVKAESMDQYGTGFTVSKNNNDLVGTPFLIVGWKFNDGKFGPRGFVSAEIVTKNGDKLILNDGSTGILAQLKMVTDQRTTRGHGHPYAGLIVKDGLTASEYFYHEGTGEISRTAREGEGWIPAATYYLSE